jgi:hypothetical protein
VRRESRRLVDYDDCRDNKRLSLVSSMNVLSKVGSYIYHMGMVNFFEYLIINLLLIIHVDRKQRAKILTGKEMTFFEANVLTFLITYIYL